MFEKIAKNRTTAIVLTWIGEYLENIVFLLFYMMWNEEFNLETVFLFTSYIRRIQEPIRQIALILNSLVQSLVSVKRLHLFLTSEELEISAVPGNGSIFMKECYFSYQKAEENKVESEVNMVETSKNVLKNINLNIKGGETVGIVGKIGCGKSSLLKSILGILRKDTGYLEVDGKIAYLGQEAWIQEGTIRSNIILDRPFDELLYSKVIDLCDLDIDLKRMSNYDMTNVSSNGNSLSGGQKARIGLARVLYSESDILLVDSPLASLDARTSALIVSRVFEKYTKNKTVIFATHNLKLLSFMDHIVVLDNNTVAWIGTYTEYAKAFNKEPDNKKTKVEEMPHVESEFEE